MRWRWTAVVLTLLACKKPAAEQVQTAASASPSPSGASSMTTDEIPPGSGNYAEVLALATRYKNGALGFEELKTALVAKKLVRHPLGCGYLMTPSPVPPPGVKFDPRMMPKDWEKTWGEVAMAYWLGRLTRDEYDRLHAAAHPNEPR